MNATILVIVIKSQSQDRFGQIDEISAILYKNGKETEVFHQKVEIDKIVPIINPEEYKELLTNFSDFYKKLFCMDIKIVVQSLNYNFFSMLKDIYDYKLIDLSMLNGIESKLVDIEQIIEFVDVDSSIIHYAKKWFIDFNFDEFINNINDTVYISRLIAKIYNHLYQ